MVVIPKNIPLQLNFTYNGVQIELRNESTLLLLLLGLVLDNHKLEIKNL